jgi:hypothetical protein
MRASGFLILFSLFAFSLMAQPDRWQQRVRYKMDVDMDVSTNQFTGKQQLEYWNNSPDTLYKLFYHLYFNAFQPGSMMDVRSRRQGTIPTGRGADWDMRVRDRIYNLKPDEIGYQKVRSLKMNGRPQSFKALETILEVTLDKPILPRTKVKLDMEFEAQVPLQIRRSGRDNPTSKVRYSMSQWYPKLCEYDYEGWHPNPYVGREFYGVWGDYEVNISIDRNYILGGTGYLQNPLEIGYGYEPEKAVVKRPATPKLTWRFKAPNVHDFMWAADPDYIHKKRKVNDSVTLHLLYKVSNTPAAQWEKILDDAARAFPMIERTFGTYPYRQYTFIHGGDGGMEYPMATLLIGPGAWLHEWLHNWYHGLLATNESLYAWMDEGFTSYAEDRVSAFLEGNTGFAYEGTYQGYFGLVKSGREEPLTTHADHFNTNSAYSTASYTKGAVFLEQLGYVIGAAQRDQLLLDYYQKWRFKHPNASDFIRLAEKRSGMKLDWYKQYWVNSTKTIDYAIDSLYEVDGKTLIRLRRVGLMPMPIDLRIGFKDKAAELHYVPLDLMYGEKPIEDTTARRTHAPWKWTHEVYTVTCDRRLADIQTVEIDASLRMADVNRNNNRLTLNWDQRPK